ncbi:hypothetical protein CPLU01_08089 [Colletotrichum plurivorum]|uniref:Nephrocystin 3-like N-terminal domain-containing protein n=1 Tax=Colletotrichum plurivorum TaxID=2175906 RepID=A0A8H6KD03_9PEZI|nr:hypothetical protein CPLU01_08089 [Colletotrichum plurivorum]
MAAARAMLDNVHNPLSMNPNDSNVYVFGNIASHNIVIACLPSGQYGITKAAIVANNMRWSFPSISIRLMVGIGGGVPKSKDIRLGDVVVSHPTSTSSGVIQYDFGKTVQEGRFQHTGVLDKPPQNLLAGVARLQADHKACIKSVGAIMSEMRHRNPSMTAYAHQGFGQDRLYDALYDHVGDSCDHCDLSRLVRRPARPSTLPMVHYGVVASANQVMKHGITRDLVAKEHNVLCFEMEAAGLMDHFPCLVIRGICDYSDSHKAKQWQEYAAATAAAYAKELLYVMPSQGGQVSAPVVDPRPAGQYNMPPQASAVDNRKAMLETLRFDRIDNRHANIKAAHAKTCQWLSKHPHYTSWLSPTDFADHHGILWISGKPGAGKSTVMKHAFTRARRKAANNAAVISFFFNARGEDLEKTTLGMHRSLLLQLLEKLPALQFILDDVKHNIQCGSLASDLNMLRDLFDRAISNLGQHQVTCFIDALDECAEDEVREMLDFFEDLGQCAVQNNIRLYTCFSSRHYPHMDIQYGLKLTLEDQPGHAKDMEEYVRTKLRTGTKKPGDDLVSEILQKASGVFMWIVLVVNILNKEFSRGRLFAVKKRLREIPPRLSDLFKDILTRDNENMEDLLLCVQWVLFGKRPLTREEYYCALAAGLEPDSLGEWDSEDITEEVMDVYIISSSKGLAEVTKSTNPTVQFIHESVRDFLLKDDGLKSLWPQLGNNVEYSSHDKLKKCCDAYTKVEISTTYWPDDDEFLLNVASEVASSTRSLVAKKFPFLEYATNQLLHHANAAGKERPQSEFLHDFSGDLQRWIKLNNLFEKHKVRRYKPITTLRYIFAEGDYESLIESVGLMGLDENTRLTYAKERHASPLLAAVRKNSQKVIKFLLDHSTEDEINQQDKSGSTSLLLASEKGYTTTVEMLLHAGADVNILNNKSESPLRKAFERGHEKVAQLLLSRRIIAQLQLYDEEGRSPLFYPGLPNYPESLQLLLDHGVTVNHRDHKGETALSKACEGKGNLEVVECLIRNGADVNIVNLQNETALFKAWEGKGNLEVVECLIRNGADVNIVNLRNETALFKACEGTGNLEVVHCLDRKIQNSANLEVVQCLIQNGANVNIVNLQNENALYKTDMFSNQNTLILKALLEAGIDLTTTDNIGRTILHVVAEWHISKDDEDEILPLLLQLSQLGISIDSKAKNGQTPLMIAASWNRENIAALLLRSGADPNVEDNNGYTSLITAIDKSWTLYYDFHVCRLLLKNGADAAKVTRNGDTALAVAKRKGAREIEELLLEYLDGKKADGG